MIRMPAEVGNQAVTAVATPSSSKRDQRQHLFAHHQDDAITPTARKPGISRTVCSQPISTPVKPAASMTKLFSSADQVAKAIGMPTAIRNSSVTGRRQQRQGGLGQGTSG